MYLGAEREEMTGNSCIVRSFILCNCRVMR